MSIAIRPNLEAHQTIVHSVQAELDLCYTCNTCPAACPVNRATSRLSPVKIVRLALYGQVDELLALPEIWYCQRCNSCLNECPMTVKPSALIGFLRREAFRRQIVSERNLYDYARVWVGYHRVRWHLAALASKQRVLDLSWDRWRKWRDTPAPDLMGPLNLAAAIGSPLLDQGVIAEAGVWRCFTCGECRGVCPVFNERDVFDPLGLFRMSNFGLAETLLESPSLWLCLGCRRCTSFCPQGVKGHQVISRLQDLAVAAGVVEADFPRRWREINQALYPYLLKEIDAVFGFTPPE
ncbi:MAG: 4Fe-4S dicluster domain-containing protein [Thermodesulfobacteriota bacterium]